MLQYPLTDHRASPHPTGEPGGLGPRLDHRNQLSPLGVGEAGRRSRNRESPQPISARDVVPLEPAIDGAPGETQFLAQCYDLLALDVAQDGLGTMPSREIPAGPGLGKELRECLQCLGGSTPKSDRFSVL